VRRSSLACLVLAVGCAHAPPKPRTEQIDDAVATTRQELTERFAKNAWPGLAVGVVVDGKLVYSEGFGVSDPTTKEPVTTRTLFRLASLTKLFTGMAILQLRDQGKLDLDDPVSKYLPEIDGVVYPTGEHPPIRIRHLVTHTSGLPHDGVQFAGMTDAELLRDLQGLSLEFTPGSASGYSNLAMALAGVIISRASGMSYRTYMQTQILDPLGMTDSVWERSAAQRPVAQGMIWDREKKSFVPIDKDLVEGASEPAGGLYSNIDDLTKFAAFEMSAWPPRTAPETLPLARSSVRESQLTAGPGAPGGNGVNWFVFKGTFGQQNNHAGALEGYRSEVELLPRRGIALLVLSGELSQPDFDGIVKLLVDEFAPLGAEPAPTAGPAMEAAVGRLVEWLNHPDRERANAVFTSEFLAVPKIWNWTDNAQGFEKEVSSTLRANGGGCRFDHFTEGGVTRVAVKLTCKDAEWKFHVAIQPAPPYLITGWWW
jgi:CubicO group peptidase (beta-lactamase class C family)